MISNSKLALTKMARRPRNKNSSLASSDAMKRYSYEPMSSQNSPHSSKLTLKSTVASDDGFMMMSFGSGATSITLCTSSDELGGSVDLSDCETIEDTSRHRVKRSLTDDDFNLFLDFLESESCSAPAPKAGCTQKDSSSRQNTDSNANQADDTQDEESTLSDEGAWIGVGFDCDGLLVGSLPSEVSVSTPFSDSLMTYAQFQSVVDNLKRELVDAREENSRLRDEMEAMAYSHARSLKKSESKVEILMQMKAALETQVKLLES